MHILWIFLFSFFSLSAKGTFEPFTGKVTGNKVRLRSNPDLDSSIVKYLQKEDLLLVTGELGDFYMVAPPREIKGYLYRSYIIDNIVDANTINIRLKPSTSAPIIGNMYKGNKVDGRIAPQNRKWLEIYSPKHMHLYVSKSYIKKLGGPEFLAMIEEKKERLQNLLSTALKEAENESKKDFSSMQIHPIIEKLETVVREFSDFPQQVLRAKEILAALKENYLNKKEQYLSSGEPIPEENFSSIEIEEITFPEVEDEIASTDGAEKPTTVEIMKREPPKVLSLSMQKWKNVEEDLFFSWQTFHPNQTEEDFYREQTLNATVIDGKLAPYNHQVKNKPGDFLLLMNGAPIAYLYSTSVDLEKWIGKHVHLMVSPRPNHHFAFPAYFVIGFAEEEVDSY